MATQIVLAKKQLTPNQFGLNMTPVDAATLLRRVNSTLKSMVTRGKMSNNVFMICDEIMKLSNKGMKSFNIAFSELVTPQEVGIIVSDFGEVSGALYMLKYSGTPYVKVKFPVIANEKLIDYILIDKEGFEHPFSAKAGAGGKPSITAVTPNIRTMKALKGKPKKAAEVILAIGVEEKNEKGGSTGTDLFKGPLLAADILGKEIPAYDKLLEVLKNPKLKTGYSSGVPTSEHLDKAMSNAGMYPACVEDYFKPFLNAAKQLGFELKDETSVKRAINLSPYNLPGGKPHRDKRWGLLHYPITANLISWLNKEENEATKLLSKAANSMTVTQIYLDVMPKNKPTSCVYTVKGFSDAKFQFGSPSSTPNPVGNRIGLTMIKEPKKK
jgi:hypothetical protein